MTELVAGVEMLVGVTGWEGQSYGVKMAELRARFAGTPATSPAFLSVLQVKRKRCAHAT
jgi:hypothetical protein